ncbi:MAG: hypothetical protein DRJ40_06750 [Thermoprotei archaeon]|nr:MAG: hypothetical protein DRJ40_06750 [Thermoprotei archaeon]
MMRVISVRIPKSYLDNIKRLIEEGRYSSVSEFVRAAIMELLKKNRRVEFSNIVEEVLS